jgi:hypothetical protein
MGTYRDARPGELFSLGGKYELRYLRKRVIVEPIQFTDLRVPHDVFRSLFFITR